MFAIILSSLTSAKEVTVPGAYCDFVESELVLTFSPKDNYDSFVIFTKPENFMINNHYLKYIYTNPTSLTIKSDGNYLNYTYIQLKKDMCVTLDFILNRESTDWVEIDPYYMEKGCFVFANFFSTDSVFYRMRSNISLYLYNNYIMDGESYLNWPESYTYPLNYNTLLVQYVPSYRGVNNYFGINNGTRKSSVNVYHVPAYDSHMTGIAIVDDITDFKYGNYDIDVKGEYILTIPANSELLITRIGNVTINAYSGTSRSFDTSPYFQYLGYSFKNDGYIRITGNSYISFVMLYNGTSVLNCKEVITMVGDLSYKLKYEKDSQYCVYLASHDGKIKVEENKYSKYYDVNGKEISYKDKFDDAVVVSIDNPGKKSSIKFKVKGVSMYPTVIRNVREYNKLNILVVTEKKYYIINEELREESLDFLKWLIPLYLGGIIVVVAIVIAIIVIVIKFCICKKSQNGEYQKTEDVL